MANGCLQLLNNYSYNLGPLCWPQKVERMEMENCNYIFSTLQIAVFYKLNFISRSLWLSLVRWAGPLTAWLDSCCYMTTEPYRRGGFACTAAPLNSSFRFTRFEFPLQTPPTTTASAAATAATTRLAADCCWSSGACAAAVAVAAAATTTRSSCCRGYCVRLC